MTPADSLVGTVFDGKYRLLEYLGEGGAGRVYKAERLEIGKVVALKVLKRPTEETIARFKREGRILCKLQHDNICQVFSIGATADGTSYMTLELIPGRSLDTLLAEGLIDRERAESILLQIALALEYAHSHRIVHRDIKPSNVIVVDSLDSIPIAKMIDFGLARPDYEDQSLTESGEVLGTPQFIAPEVWRGEAPSTLSDIYSFGLLILTLADHVSLPESLIAIGKKAAEQSPQRRYTSFHHVVEALNCQDGSIAAGLRHGQLIAISIALALTGAVVWLLTSNQIAASYARFCNHRLVEEADEQLESGNLARTSQICAEIMRQAEVNESDRSCAHLLTGCVLVLEKRSSVTRKQIFRRLYNLQELLAAGSNEWSKGRLNHARALLEEFLEQSKTAKFPKGEQHAYALLTALAYKQGRMEDRMELCRLRLEFWQESNDAAREELLEEIQATVMYCKNVDTTLQVATLCQRDPAINRLVMPVLQSQLTALAHEYYSKKQWRRCIDILWFQLKHPDYLSPSTMEAAVRILARSYSQTGAQPAELAEVRARASEEPKTPFINLALSCAFVGSGDFQSAMKTFRKVHTVPGFNRLFREIYLEYANSLFEKRDITASLDMLDLAFKEKLFTYSELHQFLGGLVWYCGTHDLQACLELSRELYRKGYLENLAEFHHKEGRPNCGPLVDLRLLVAWDYLYNFPDYEAAVKITEPLLSVLPTMNPSTRTLFYRLRLDSLVCTRRSEQALNLLVSGCDQGILSYSDMGQGNFETLKDHFSKNGPEAMAKKAEVAHLKCIAAIRDSYFDKLAKKELPAPELILRVAHDDVHSRADYTEALNITAPLLKMDAETVSPSLRSQILAIRTEALKKEKVTVGGGQLLRIDSRSLSRERSLTPATGLVLGYNYEGARKEYEQWLAPNTCRLSTREMAESLFSKRDDPSLDDLTRLAILEEVLYLASSLNEDCSGSGNLQPNEIMTIVKDLFLRYASVRKWDDCLRVIRRGRYVLQWTSDAAVVAGVDTRLAIAQYQEFQQPRFLQQINLSHLAEEIASPDLIRIYVGEVLCKNRQYKEALAVTDPLMNEIFRKTIPLIHSQRLCELRERCSRSACDAIK